MLSDPSRWGEDGKFDPATVIGLNPHQSVLVIGNPAFLPWLTKETNNIVSARRPNEILKALEHDYDRVIVGREYEIDFKLLLAQAEVALKKHQGVLVVFPAKESDEWQLKNNIDAFNHGSKVWESDTTFGRVVQVELAGGYNG